MLVPVFAAVILVGIEGLPAFPPVRAAHKLPYVLLAGGLVFAILSWRALRVTPFVAALGSAVAVGLPVWWMGRNVLANNSQKAIVVVILAVIAIAGTFLAAKLRRPHQESESPFAQAIFATSLAGALVAIFGGYMGMAMFNGALAAFAGGYLLVAYIAYLRGNGPAFALGGVAAWAFAWVAFMGILATALLAPQASTPALLLAALTLGVPLLTLDFATVRGAPRALRPLLLGALAAIPALAAILVAWSQYPG